MGCSELWGEYLNKGSQEKKPIKYTSEAQLMCILFDVACYINSPGTNVKEQTHIHAAYKHKVHGHAHSQLHRIVALFIVLSASVSWCCAARSWL